MATVIVVMPGKADYKPRFFSQHLSLIISTTPKLYRPCFTPPNHSDRPTDWQQHPQHQAELMWRISLTVSVLLLCLLAVPFLLFQPGAAATPYNILIAIGLFWFTKTG